MQQHCVARRGVEGGEARRAEELHEVAHGHHGERILPLAPVARRRRHSRLLESLEVGPSTGQPVDGVLVVVLVVSVAEKIFVRLRRLRRRGASRGLASRSLTCRAPETIALGRSGV
eukprot:2736495-Prymnesium_polylepis.1